MVEYNNKVDKVSQKYAPYLILLIFLSMFVETYAPGKIPVIYNYVIYLAMAGLGLWYYWVHRKFLFNEYPYITSLYVFMFIYVIAAIVKQVFIPSSIYPFQRMQVCCSFLAVGITFIFMREGVINKTLKLWWKWVPILCLLVSLLNRNGYYLVRMMCLVFLFLMYADCISKKKRIYTYFLYAIIVIFGIYQRIDYILVIVPLAILFMLKFNWFVGKHGSIVVYHCLMWIPVLFLILALSGKFNVLAFDMYVEGTYTSSTGENMLDDTRTMLYEEAISSAISNDYLWFGRTPGYGYDSYFVKLRDKTYLEVEGVYPQRNSEVFIVNMFTWCGIIGLLFWFCFFYTFGIRNLRKSKNCYIRGLIIYVGLFWVCDWISNEFVAPSTTYTLLFIILSICSQNKYLRMNDKDIKQSFQKLFN